MNQNKTKLSAEFRPETRFELHPAAGVAFRAILPGLFEKLKDDLLAEKLFFAQTVAWHVPLRRAANEAAALAWSHPFPLLVLPELFAEKVAETTQHLARQEKISAKIKGAEDETFAA